MGTDKALIEIEGRALAIRLADEIGKVCGSVAIVGDPLRYRRFGLQVIPDNFPGEGPLAGVEAALAATKVEWNLMVACDMPDLKAPIFEELLDSALDCNVPRLDDGQTQPLCAVYHRRVHSAIRDLLKTGVRRVIDVPGHLETLGFAVRYLRMESHAPFANLNTPEDVRRRLNA